MDVPQPSRVPIPYETHSQGIAGRPFGLLLPPVTQGEPWGIEAGCDKTPQPTSWKMAQPCKCKWPEGRNKQKTIKTSPTGFRS